MLSPELQLIAIIVGPAGLTGLVIAWMGHRNQRAKPAAVTSEAAAIIGQGTAHQILIDQQNLLLERQYAADKRLIEVVEELTETIRERFPKRRT